MTLHEFQVSVSRKALILGPQVWLLASAAAPSFTPEAVAQKQSQAVASIVVSPREVVRSLRENASSRGSGSCQQFQAGAYDANQRRIYTLNKFTWSVSNGQQFMVDASIGLVCHKPNSANLQAGAKTTVTAHVEGAAVEGAAVFIIEPHRQANPQASPGPARGSRSSDLGTSPGTPGPKTAVEPHGGLQIGEVVETASSSTKTGTVKSNEVTLKHGHVGRYESIQDWVEAARHVSSEGNRPGGGDLFQSLGQIIGGASPATAVLSRGPALSSGGSLNLDEVASYRLTMEQFKKFAKVQRLLSTSGNGSVPGDTGFNTVLSGGSSAASPAQAARDSAAVSEQDQMAQMMEAMQPDLSAAVNGAGLSMKEFCLILYSWTLAQTAVEYMHNGMGGLAQDSLSGFRQKISLSWRDTTQSFWPYWDNKNDGPQSFSNFTKAASHLAISRAVISTWAASSPVMLPRLCRSV